MSLMYSVWEDHPAVPRLTISHHQGGERMKRYEDNPAGIDLV